MVAVYSIDKLIAETRRVAAEFRRTTNNMLPVSGELARYDVTHHLSLKLNESRATGLDAFGQGDREGKKIQIKGRVIVDETKTGHRIGQLNLDGDWDLVILSLMDANFEPYEMYEASREDLEDAISRSTASGNKRGILSVNKFKSIGQLVWTREQGVEETTAIRQGD